MFPGPRGMRTRHTVVIIVERTLTKLTLQVNETNSTMAGEEEGWSFPRGHTYQPHIVEFMGFFHGGVEYKKDAVFVPNPNP